MMENIKHVMRYEEHWRVLDIGNERSWRLDMELGSDCLSVCFGVLEWDYHLDDFGFVQELFIPAGSYVTEEYITITQTLLHFLTATAGNYCLPRMLNN